LNTPGFRDSLREAYENQSMQEKQEVLVEEEATPKATHVVIKSTQFTYMDEIKLRAKRPNVTS